MRISRGICALTPALFLRCSRGRSSQGILISIVMADPVHKWAVASARRRLPVFLPAERRQVEVVVRAGQQISAASVGRVGVKNTVAAAQEGAQAVRFALGEIGLALAQEFYFVPVVIFDRSDGFVHRDVEVVVEVAPER